MSKVLIINTGGTIGMVRSEQGYVPDLERFQSPNAPLLAEDGISIRYNEAAIAKMYYQFSKNYDTKTVCRLMETNLRGEES